jgi:hypothetical protein
LRLLTFELNRIPQHGLGNWKVQDIGVSGAELETASRAWQAYRTPTPEACFALLATDLTGLPLLRLALHRLLAELPSSTTGLGATEMRMLELLAWGFANANPLFYLRDLRGKYVFGEEEHGYLLDGLARGPVPAVAGLDDELRTISRENLGARHKAIRRSRSLSLTKFGRRRDSVWLSIRLGSVAVRCGICGRIGAELDAAYLAVEYLSNAPRRTRKARARTDRSLRAMRHDRIMD